jgi:Flp pilus assembly protein TadG
MKKILLRKERGATAVEFAIIATLFFSVVFGIIEFGILMFDQHVLTNASREGARAGIVMRVPRLSNAEIENIVEAYAQEHMVSFNASSTLVFDPPISPVEASRIGNTFGTPLVVTVKYPFHFLVLSGFGLGPITLTAETRMRME